MPLQVSGTKWGRTTKASVPSKAGRLISTEKGRNHFLGGRSRQSGKREVGETPERERHQETVWKSYCDLPRKSSYFVTFKTFQFIIIIIRRRRKRKWGERRWMFPTSFFSLGCKWLRQTIILKNPFFSLVYKNHIWFTTLSILTALSNVRRTTVSWVRFALGARLADPESPLYPFLVSSWHPPVLISRVVVERRLR